ncbi:magnesium transporter [Acetivibrio ethanolgignens]|uniref:Magnesium transporter MgtE n=1 Tax=Acetivibrio ethanolgignens TaxID=290052 RepID=A0A0V8QGW1_9FIRM|nr:magnesium transporter [Acetivibrio ethanolgignens]KSV59658.1 divalent cation transporter [Acetivibrio ethanolgignens]
MKESYVQEIIDLIRRERREEELLKQLERYHENDIAEALELLTGEERKRLYRILGPERISEIFSYLDDASSYLEEMELANATEIIGNMDSDDAVDVLENMDEEVQKKIVSLLNAESSRDIKLIRSYDEDEIGSKMTTNYIEIKKGLNVKQAMKELISQAEDNDNIYTVYVCNEDGSFYGALDLKDLITAREHADLQALISNAYPFVRDHEKVADCLEKIKGYAEDSIPVLNEKNQILGVITSQDIIEVVDDELGDDYAKLAGLTAEEDLNENLFESMKKRLPWLIVLLALGIGVSSVVGIFEQVVAQIAIIVCFQSLILDMAGNVGTQSLAVTIRVLMDGHLKTSQKLQLVLKEMRVGLCNGLVLGVLSFAFIGIYIWQMKNYDVFFAFTVSLCVGVALMAAMVISSMIGTIVPMFFHRIHIDPAVASGPLITTINDLVAVISYYGLAWGLLIKVLHVV